MRGRGAVLRGLLVSCAVLAVATQAQALPTFTASFSPSTVGPGGVSTLRYTLSNPDATPLADVAFTHDLPAALSVATPPVAGTDCVSGSVDADAGAAAISLAGARLGAFTSCGVWVNVTGSTAGAHGSTTDALSWDGGTGPTTAPSLAITQDRPAVSLTLTPAVASVGETSRLVLTVDNALNASALSTISWGGQLPGGVRIASPPAASSDCTNASLPPNYAPAAGSRSFSYFANGLLPTFPTVAAGASCTIEMDLESTAAGAHAIVLNELLASNLSSGKVGAVLVAELTAVEKTFLGGPVRAGSTVELQYTLTNFSRRDAATEITFTDDLDGALAGLAASGLPRNDVCGSGSTLSGSGVVSLVGGALAPEQSCTFSVSVDVPGGAVAGIYPSATSAVGYQANGSSRSWDGGSDDLAVAQQPQFDKSFATAVAPAGSVVLHYDITNTSASDALSDVAFVEPLTGLIAGLTASSAPAKGFCGAEATMAVVALDTNVFGLSVTGASLPADGSCNFEVTLSVPIDAPGGSYESTSEYLTATLAGEPVWAAPAVATLVVADAPRLEKAFVDGTVLPGESTTLRYSLSVSETAADGVANISFTDDLAAVAAGLTFTGLPQADACGVGSLLEASAGDTLLTLTGAALSPGESCAFDVEVALAQSTPAASYVSSTSDLSGESQGLTVAAPGASASLQVRGLTLEARITSGTAYPGGAAQLELALDNTSASVDATAISFTLPLGSALPGLVAGAPLPVEPCGPGSTLSGTSTLVLVGGNLNSGASCAFTVPLEIPAAAASDAFTLRTGSVAATWGGVGSSFPAASAPLLVGAPLLFTKEFVDDPGALGATVVLRFTIANADPTRTATGLAFDDDLDALLAGLTASGLPRNDVCGTGSTLSGTDVVSLTGGSVEPSGMCTFDVDVSVPADATFVPNLVNVTSTLTGQLDGTSVSAPPATDTLALTFATLSGSVLRPTGPGGMTTLQFEIDNLDSLSAMSDLAFLLDLDDALPGLVALGLPVAGVCGTGSELAGSMSPGSDTRVALRGGQLAPGSSCAFAVDVLVPEGASLGNVALQTSPLGDGASEVASAASLSLSVEPVPTITAAFDPAVLSEGGTAQLRYVIDHAAGTAPVERLAFSQTLPDGIVLADPPSGSSSCGGGLVSAVAGQAALSFTEGTLAAGASCSVSVVVTRATAGASTLTLAAAESSYGPLAGASADVEFTALVMDAGADGSVDAGAGDAGVDAGTAMDAGADAAVADAGIVSEGGSGDGAAGGDASAADAGQDGAVADAGPGPATEGGADAAAGMPSGGGGCSCTAAGGALPADPSGLLVLLWAWRRRKQFAG